MSPELERLVRDIDTGSRMTALSMFSDQAQLGQRTFSRRDNGLFEAAPRELYVADAVNEIAGSEMKVTERRGVASVQPMNSFDYASQMFREVTASVVQAVREAPASVVTAGREAPQTIKAVARALSEVQLTPRRVGAMAGILATAAVPAFADDADTAFRPISLDGPYQTSVGINYQEGFTTANSPNVPTVFNAFGDFRQADLIIGGLPYDGLQVTANSELRNPQSEKLTFDIALRTPRMLDDWLSITAAMQGAEGDYYGTTFFASLAPDFLRALEVRGGLVVSHGTNGRGEQPNGGFGGFRYRNPWLTLDADLHGATGNMPHARGFAAVYIPSNAEEPSIVDRAIEKLKELVGKETVHPEEGFYLSAGANSNETAVLSHLAYVNQGNWGGYLRYRGNWTTGAQMAQLFIADEFTYDRNHFDQRNRGMSGTEMLRVATGDALPGWLPLTPLGTQHVAGNIEFSLDEETLLLDAAAHYSPVPGLFLELGAGYRMERQPTTHHPRIIAGILAPIYDENKVMLMVRGIVDPQTGDTNAQLDVRMNF